jgi:ApaG protein
MFMTPVFEATTAGITVSVRVFYLADRSNPEQGEFFWAYQITIANTSQITVQLLKRTWHITDENGRTQRVHGEGVVGETPVLEPGESFQYTSGTPLATSSGFMTGKYHMIEVNSGEKFDIAIPAFSLDSPAPHARLH